MQSLFYRNISLQLVDLRKDSAHFDMISCFSAARPFQLCLDAPINYSVIQSHVTLLPLI
jgi:hypothetical protein